MQAQQAQNYYQNIRAIVTQFKTNFIQQTRSRRDEDMPLIGVPLVPTFASDFSSLTGALTSTASFDDAVASKALFTLVVTKHQLMQLT